MYSSTATTHLTSAIFAKAHPAPMGAALITLTTMQRSPLLVVDPRAGHQVAQCVRSMHCDPLRLLAWAVVADRVHCLLATRQRSLIPYTVSELMRRTTDALARLGHDHVWQWPAAMTTLHPGDDLARCIDLVLRAPERSGLATSWLDWPWVGSCHWSELDLDATNRLAPGLLWLDVMTA